MADEKQLAKLRALAEMTDVQKAHHCKLDEQGQADFEAMSAAERDAVVKALQVTDETFTDLDGNTVAKSKVGDAAYSVMKSQHDRLVKMQDEIDTSRLTKQAQDELAHLPGDLVAKAKVLKAVEAMPQGTRDALMQMLKAGDAASAPGFKPAAAAGDGETSIEKREEALIAKFKAEMPGARQADVLKAVYASEEYKQLAEKEAE